MTETIDLSPPTCGTCAFSRPVPKDLMQIACHGMPPQTVSILQQMPNGQIGTGIQLMRPNLPRSETACALWKRKMVHDALSAPSEPVAPNGRIKPRALL